MKTLREKLKQGFEDKKSLVHHSISFISGACDWGIDFLNQAWPITGPIIKFVAWGERVVDKTDSEMSREKCKEFADSWREMCEKGGINVRGVSYRSGYYLSLAGQLYVVATIPYIAISEMIK